MAVNQAVKNLFDRVLCYKGRVWTIYALSGNHDGVFAYQGLKPYPTFKYDSNRSDRNISYVTMQEALECLIDGDQIAECVKREKTADAKELNKKMAVEFIAYLTGHGKAKINSEIEERFNGFSVQLGQVCYTIWKMDGRLHLHHNLHGNTTGTTFDFVTWKHDSNYEDRQAREARREEEKRIIEEYKYQESK